MSEVEFSEFINLSAEDYAKQQLRTGNWLPPEALTKARDGLHKLLPQGLASKGNYLFSIEDSKTGSVVGGLWFTVWQEPLCAFLMDIHIYDGYQQRGYGTESMKALEEKVKDLDIDRISLGVSGDNEAAIGLYKKMGYGTL